ncbi:MAG TPA: DUF1003 domain-containing protein [Gaiellaceae bacterium]
MATQEAHRGGAFGADNFGQKAEAFARFFGTPKFLIGQTLVVAAWVALNAAVVALRWDPYPFILLNLLFSTQAAYAAPLILLAQTRQADRDKEHAEAIDSHREAVAQHQEHQEEMLIKVAHKLEELLGENTELTRQDKELTESVVALTKEIHGRVLGGAGGSGPSAGEGPVSS